MKTLKTLEDVNTGIIKEMIFKKQFECKGYNFAIVLEPDATRKCFKLIHFETGGQIAMLLPHNYTIKDYEVKSRQSLESLINRIGIKDFENVINSYPKIN